MKELSTAELVHRDILSLIMKIKKCSSKTKYNMLVDDLVQYYDLATSLEIKDVPDLDLYSNKSYSSNFMKYFEQYMNQNDLDLSFHHEITSLPEEIRKEIPYFYLYDIESRDNIPIERSYQLAHDFASEYSKEFVSLFESLLIENRMVLKGVEDPKYSGYTFSGISFFSPYVIINYNHQIVDSATMVHELGHVHEFRKVQNLSYPLQIQRIKNNVTEVYSHFIELLFYDYLDKTKENKSDVLGLRKTYDINMMSYLENLQMFVRQGTEEHPEIDYELYSTTLLYSYGMLLGYEYYDMYQIDPEKTKKNIDDFIMNSGNYSFLELINRYGLDQEKIESGEVIKKHLSKHF